MMMEELGEGGREILLQQKRRKEGRREEFCKFLIGAIGLYRRCCVDREFFCSNRKKTAFLENFV